MIFNRKQLQEKLNILAKAYNPKTPMPSLQFIKFDNDTLTVSDNNVTIIIDFESNIQALIPFKQLYDIVNKLTADELDLVINNNQAIIKCGRSRFTLNLGDFNEFPTLLVDLHDEGIKIDCSEFINVISSVVYACSKEEKRPILTGISFNEYAVATDGYRLARVNKNLGLNCVISYNDINNLISILKDYNTVKIRNNKNKATFEFEDGIYETRLLDGNYPDTSKLIAKDYSYSIKVHKQTLIEAIERVNIFSGEHAIVIFEADNNILKLQSSTTQIGNANELIDCENNDKIKFACNGNSLNDALNKFNNDIVELKLVSNVRPITIQENDMIALILPVKVAG